jgi:hypothetical protein
LGFTSFSPTYSVSAPFSAVWVSVKQPGIWAQKIIADNDAAMNDAKSKCL